MVRFAIVVAAALQLMCKPLLGTAEQKPLVTISDARAAEHIGEEAIVSGKIAAVSKSASGIIYLNFGDRFPRQTFNGVVYLRDQEKVGDLKGLEGQSVTLRGRIVLSPDKKPQIVITAPDQIAPTEGAEPADEASTSATTAAPVLSAATAQSASPATPTPTLANIPSRPAQPPVPSPPTPARKIVLAPEWTSAAETGQMTLKDLATLFGTLGRANDDLSGDPSILVYAGIPFLTPVAEARKRLRLERTESSKINITCPGLPLGSLSAHVFSGVFDGGFNRLFLVTDRADQLVSVLVVDDNPRGRTSDTVDLAGYHTYNFISYRVKGSDDLVITHQGAPAEAGLVVVESRLIDPNDAKNPATRKSVASTSKSTTSRAPRSGKVLEHSRWYVPVPFVNLILHCVGNR